MLSLLAELNPAVQIALVAVAVLAGFKLYLYVTLGVCTSRNKLNGKTVIITGANSGIGKETALDIARRGARLILACRDLKKAAQARDEIVQETGNQQIVVRRLDLSSLSSVHKFAADILNSERRLDVLINNAGCAGMEKRITEDGLEFQMQSNHLGHFLLTNLLLGLLKRSSPSRIVHVSSMAHAFTKEFDLDNINSDKEYDAGKVYYYSKLSQILSARYLAPFIQNDGVTVNCVHPGAVETNIFRHSPKWTQWIVYLILPFFKSSKEGAQTSIHVAVSDEAQGITGQYFSDCKVAAVSKLAQDNALAKKLWEKSEQLVHLKSNERFF